MVHRGWGGGGEEGEFVFKEKGILRLFLKEGFDKVEWQDTERKMIG